MKKVYVTARFNAQEKDRLEQEFPELRFVYEREDDLNVIIGNYPPEKLKEFKELEWIQTGAVGVDGFIRKGILADGVILTNAVDVHSQEVAEHLLAMIFNITKKLYRYRDDQREHIWRDEGQVKQINKLKVTIVGFGHIGTALAKMLKALGVHTIGVKRTLMEKPDCLDELYGLEDLDKAISDVDFVVAVVPGNKANAGLFTLDTFQQMRKDTVFINAGRGNLYSEETLKEVLEQKIIAAVSTDVYAKEPVPTDSWLWDEKELVMTPHAAGSYHLDSAREALFELVCDNLRRYLKGETLRNIVSERE